MLDQYDQIERIKLSMIWYIGPSADDQAVSLSGVVATIIGIIPVLRSCQTSQESLKIWFIIVRMLPQGIDA